MEASAIPTVSENELLDYILKVCKADKFETPREEARAHLEGVAKGVLRNGCIFKSDFVGGRMHGQGEMYWPDGQSYTGQFSHNLMEGEGVMRYNNGASYEGGMKGGLRDGKGTFTDKSGASYEGEWEMGVRKGHGHQVYSVENGASYTGLWLDDVRHGEGEMLYPSGNRYVGNWKQNIRHGQGEMHWVGRKERYVGEWCDGVQHGEGVHTWVSDSQPMPLMGECEAMGRSMAQVCVGAKDGFVNNRYSGTWVWGERHGHGIFYYSNGNVYEGHWEHNLKEGEGLYRLIDGTEFPAAWKDDRMCDPETGEPIDNRAQYMGIEKPLTDADRINSPLKSTNPNTLDLDFVLQEVEGARQRERELRHQEDPKILKKVEDLMFRSRAELADIYRYYCALGVTRPEECQSLSGHQFCQLCKDCQLPSKFFSLAIIDQMYREGNLTAGTSKLSLQMFITVLMKVAHVRYQELPNLYERCDFLINERVIPNAKVKTQDHFRHVLYKPVVQATIMKHQKKMGVLFQHYAAADLHSTAEAFLQTDTINLQEYLLCISDLGFIKREVDIMGDIKKQAAIEADGAAKYAKRAAITEKETKRKLVEQGIKTFYKPEFTTKQVYDTFTHSNLDSDWEQMDFFTLDTEMVLMEFLEGLARCAWLRHVKKHGDQEEPNEAVFAKELDMFLADCSGRFPYWSKYLSTLDEMTSFEKMPSKVAKAEL